MSSPRHKNPSAPEKAAERSAAAMRTAPLAVSGAPAISAKARAPIETNEINNLLAQYGCGPIRFSGSDNAFYERHLVFDAVSREVQQQD